VSHNPRDGDDVAGTDDLTRIAGIGSKTAGKLNSAGIRTYADLASRSADDIVKLLPDVRGLSAARLDSWRDQAGQLAAAAPEIPAAAPGNGQHYERAEAAVTRVSSAVVSVERTSLRAAEPFTMTVTIDLGDPAGHGDRLAYSAVVVARPLSGGPKLTVAQAKGLMALTSPTIGIDAAGLPPGAYRLDGAVSLREPGTNRPADLAALIEGLLVQVLPG
jgi:Helix-hairpin-helix domain